MERGMGSTKQRWAWLCGRVENERAKESAYLYYQKNRQEHI
jgi:hypothetical protein